MWDFPHLVKAREIYFFISFFLYLFVHEREVLVTWFLFAFSEPWRLDSSQRFFIVYCTAAISLLSRWVLENLFGISYLFLGDFRFQGVYNRRFFHPSQHAETRLVFSAGCTGAFTFSQANIYRLGPSVRVVPDWKESLYSRKPTFVGLNVFVRVALQRVSGCLKVSHECLKMSHECLKVSQTERNYCLPWTVKSVIYFNKLSF